MKSALAERYAERMRGVLSCYDRILIMGTLPGVSYAEGMTSFLHAKGIRIFDYTQFVEPLRERSRLNAQALAEDSGVQIDFMTKKHIRKEEVVAAVIKTRGDHPGLVHIRSAIESCTSYKPWHDKTTGRTYLRGDTGKCLHYYFYFIDAELAYVSCECQRGLRFACSSTAMVTAGWRGSSPARALPLPPLITPFCVSRTCRRFEALCSFSELSV